MPLINVIYNAFKYSVFFISLKLSRVGNIRVYCRIRPFLPGQKAKQTIVDYVGDNGELTVVNPSKQGKEIRRSFKFNQVYGSKATQGFHS